MVAKMSNNLFLSMSPVRSLISRTKSKLKIIIIYEDTDGQEACFVVIPSLQYCPRVIYKIDPNGIYLIVPY